MAYSNSVIEKKQLQSKINFYADDIRSSPVYSATKEQLHEFYGVTEAEPSGKKQQIDR